MEALCWTLLGTFSIISAAMVVTRKNPVYGALWLIGFFFSLSGIYVLLKAPFIAAVQLFIYVGAIIVLYLFVIMMVDFEKLKKWDRPRLVTPIPAFIISAGLLVLLILPIRMGIHKNMGTTQPIPSGFGSNKWMADELYRNYPFPIELASILLIIALVGAFALTGHFIRKRRNLKVSTKKEKDNLPKEEVAAS
ncbi:MAG: NADH-quinone oxidoreductase subunit J [Planctomycetota bacterium]|nr:MAG: NADH-quinone oxidoreductase subunit J [Planctomycetota bacterium]